MPYPTYFHLDYIKVVQVFHCAAMVLSTVVVILWVPLMFGYQSSTWTNAKVSAAMLACGQFGFYRSRSTVLFSNFQEIGISFRIQLRKIGFEGGKT